MYNCTSTTSTMYSMLQQQLYYYVASYPNTLLSYSFCFHPLASLRANPAMSSDEYAGPNRMGEVSFPDDETVYLKPALLVKRQQWRRDHPLLSLGFPISPLILWYYGLTLLLHPVSVVLLRKYQEDFQSVWHNQLLETNGTHPATLALLRGAVSILDTLAVCVIDSSPPLTAAALFLHVTICLGYLAYNVAIRSGASDSGKGFKQDQHGWHHVTQADSFYIAGAGVALVDEI